MLTELFAIDKIQTSLKTENSALLLDNQYGLLFDNYFYLPNKKNITQITDGQYNLDFTISAFNNLLNEWKFASSVQRIPKSSKFYFSKMKLNKTFFSAQGLYSAHLFETFFTFKKNRSLKTLNDFVITFFQIAKQKDRIISLSKFVESSVASIFCSGLAFSVFSENSSSELRNEYILDPYYPVFRNLCLKHNFLIDNRAPWIIVYRVQNDTPQKSNSYINVYEIEISLLLEELKNLWNFYISSDNLSTKDKNDININDQYINSHMFITEYIAAKCREQNITISSQLLNDLRRFMSFNNKHNGIMNTVYKLSHIEKNEHNIIPESWR